MSNEHQFKYHLSHHRAPSHVPITVQQQQQQQLQVHAARSHAHPVVSNSLEPSLVQIQVPLQLHLKLKPLPLPMPPPKWHQQHQENVNDNSRQQEEQRKSFEQQAEKKRRSLSDSNPSTMAANESAAALNQSNKVKEKHRRDLMAFTWREAKRILLLNSMSSSVFAQAARLERRFGSLKAPNEAQFEHNRSSSSDSLGQDLSENLILSTTSSTVAPPTSTSANRMQTDHSTNSWTPIETSTDQIQSPTTTTTTTTTTSEPNSSLFRVGEVRRQRHSSQQQVSVFSSAESEK